MIYIGIDTGVDTGLAVWDSTSRRLVSVQTVKIHRAMETVLCYRATEGDGLVVVFEDARQRRWIPREGSWSRAKGRAMGAGSVKRDAVVWEDFLTDYGIRYLMEPPKKGLTKWDKDTFAHVTGFKGRTSHHGRDAALLVFGR